MGTVAKQRSRRRRGGFLDLFGGFRRTTAPAMTTVGVGGAAVFGGFVDEREDKAELRGRKRYETFSNMLANCSIVAAGVRYYLGLIGKAGWKVEPADDSSQAKELAEKVEEILFDDMTTTWSRVVRRAAMFRFWGFSVQEWTARRLEDGTIGLLDVEPRPQITIELWDLDESGTVFGMVQRSPQTQQEIYLPRSKVVYIVDDSLNDSPEGLGLFRHLAEGARRLGRYEQLEGWGYETDLRGIPVGRGPFAELLRQEKAGEITTAERQEQEQHLRTFLEKHIKTPSLALLLDSVPYQTEDEKATPSSVRQWDVELLQSNATSHEAVARAIERINRELARIMGVEQLLLGERGAGSLALSRDKTQQFGLLVDGSLNEVSETFETDLVDPIFSLNGWPMELRPSLKTEAVRYRDVNDITASLRDLAQAGAPIDVAQEAVGEIFDILGLTRPNVEEMIVDAMLTGNGGGDMGLDGDGSADDDEDTEEVNPTDGDARGNE